ncbi:rod-binding protein [Thermoanaerobacterium sp. R66]|uniref:rod-binding protein n=1 Tax=Thermoanaerobacterium sp. R66 TaxID=2742479 RepID=UPI0023808799|nr:rod-binding protein [Thermoanaerobacterium sp. R66]MDE4542789.1 rod-binding protein [Thermoanaerobacterium sp. R66]
MNIDPVSSINEVNQVNQLNVNTNTGDFQKAIQDALNNKDKQKLKEACIDLEAVFVNQMLTEMRNTIPKDPLTGDDFATDVFTTMMYDNYAKSIAQNSGIGLADEMYNQLSKKI